MRKPDTAAAKKDAPIIEAAGEVLREAVTKEELVREFGEDRLTEDADGKWNVELRGAAEIEKFEEMDQRRSRAAAKMGAAVQSAASTVKIKDASGKRVSVPEHHAERIDRLNHYRRTGKW